MSPFHGTRRYGIPLPLSKLQANFVKINLSYAALVLCVLASFSFQKSTGRDVAFLRLIAYKTRVTGCRMWYGWVPVSKWTMYPSSVRVWWRQRLRRQRWWTELYRFHLTTWYVYSRCWRDESFFDVFKKITGCRVVFLRVSAYKSTLTVQNASTIFVDEICK